MNANVSLFVFIFFFFLQQLVAGVSPSCGPLIDHITRDSTAMVNAEKVLGKKLTEEQKQALIPLAGQSNQTISTENLAIENRSLLKAGFSEGEIDKMRIEGVLTNSVIRQAVPVPKKVQFVGADTIPIDNKSIESIKNGKTMTYYFADDGKLYLSGGSELGSSTSDTVFMMDKAGGNQNFVKEVGKISYNSSKKTFDLKPQVSADLSAAETSELVNALKGSAGGIPVRTMGEGMSHSKLVNCLDVLSSQYKANNFVLNKLIGDNAVAVSALAITEVAGANRLGTQNGREVITSDLIGTNLNSVVGGIVGRRIVLNNANLPTSIAIRSSVGLGMIELQKNVYLATLTDNAKERAENIAEFDRAHFGARLFVNHYFDQFLVQKLPTLLFNACRKNSKAQLLISPRAVRIYERFGSAVIYYGLRGKIIGE